MAAGLAVCIQRTLGGPAHNATLDNRRVLGAGSSEEPLSSGDPVIDFDTTVFIGHCVILGRQILTESGETCMASYKILLVYLWTTAELMMDVKLPSMAS